MKCPRCGYISFDHNKYCPKCKTSFREERAKMTLPDFKPDPPFLLASLVDEATAKNIASFGVDTGRLPDIDFEERTMISDPEDEDTFEGMEINFGREIAGQLEKPAKNEEGMDEKAFQEQLELHKDIDGKEFALEFYDLSLEQKSSQGSFLRHDDEHQPNELRQDPACEEGAPLLFEKDFVEEPLEKSSKEEIEFDSESYLLDLENEIRHKEPAMHSESEYKGISFDPVAMGLKPGSREDEELMINSDGFDLDLPENEDEQKKS